VTSISRLNAKHDIAGSRSTEMHLRWIWRPLVQLVHRPRG